MASLTATPPLRKATSWRVTQICLYLASLAFSIGTLIGYKSLNALFDNDIASCILNATAIVIDKENSQNCSLTLERPSEHTCKFVYFDVICSVIYSIIGCWFFIACTSEAKTRPDETVIQSWKLVVPSIFFTCILLLLSLICSSFITSGCLRFKLSNHLTLINATSFSNQVRTFGVVAETFTWLCTTTWLLALGLLICRCCVAADFVTSNEQQQPQSMGTDSSPTVNLAGRSRIEACSWCDSFGLTYGSVKDLLKNWRNDNSQQRTLLRPAEWVHSSSTEIQQAAADAHHRQQHVPPTILPLVTYSHRASTTTLSDTDYESAMGDSQTENTSLIGSELDLGASGDGFRKR
ncbi:uncharacterized protein LOC111245778 isoform X2 [Varroa destructor]|uniref:Uncharacterized protein n=1 Tax=Varroa destructor TaxID=109461 RepID=A0A7M7JP77_VARDE|nr:uncharacterized protein LOC111245778 isoform X2 [Varroa destructor]